MLQAASLSRLPLGGCSCRAQRPSASIGLQAPHIRHRRLAPLRAASDQAPKHVTDLHQMLNVDADSMNSDPGDLGRVAEWVLDEYERLSDIKAPKASAKARAPKPLKSHGDPRRMLNVDVDPQSSDPGDLGRVAPGVLEKFEHLDKINERYMKQQQQGTAGRKPGRGGRQPQRGGGAKKPSGRAKSAKQQIRDYERLLKKPDLDPKMRGRLEAKLQELQAAAAEAARKERERKFAVRYHKVRFFERVKLERRLHRVQAQLAEAVQAATAADSGGGGDAVAALRAQVAALQEDLQYVQHFPKGEKYVSLLRQADGAEAQAKLEAERERLRALVKRQLAEAAMLAEADEGAGLAAVPAPGVQAGVDPGAAAAAAAAEQEEEEDDFFLGSDEEAAEEAPAAAPAAAPAKAAAAVAKPAAAAAAGTKRKLQQLAAHTSSSGQEDEEGEEESSSEEEEQAGPSSGSSEEEEDSEGASGSSGGEEGGSGSEDESEQEQHQQRQQHHEQQRQQLQQQQKAHTGPRHGSKPWQQQGQQQRQQGKQAWKQQSGPSIGKPWKQQRQQLEGKPHPSPAGSSGSKPQQQQQQRPAKPKPAKVGEKQPLRTRAEGGRKRRKKGKS